MAERIPSINRECDAWCCAGQGSSQEALAHAIGITPAHLDKVMAGEHGLSFNQLRKLADWSGRGVLFFMEPPPGRCRHRQSHHTSASDPGLDQSLDPGQAAV